MDGTRAIVDLDGVILQYAESLRDTYPELTDSDIRLWFHGAYGSQEFLKSTGARITRSEYEAAEPGIFLRAEPYKNALEGMEMLGRLYDRITVLTAVNSKEAALAKRYWLANNGIPHDELITRSVTFDKSNVFGQLYIEDNDHTLMKCRIKHPEARCVLMRRMWNEHCSDFETFDNWRDLITVMES